MSNATHADYLMMIARVERNRRKGNPAAEVEADPGPETNLHNSIIRECIDRRWIHFHGSTADATQRTLGEPDFILLLPNGRFLLVECKSATGKLSEDQQTMVQWAKILGHKIHIVRSFSEFLAIIKEYAKENTNADSHTT